MKQEVRYILLDTPLEDFARAVDDLGWERRPTPCVEGARAAWVPDDGGEVLWIEPVSASTPVLQLMGSDLEQLEEDLAFLAGARRPSDIINLMAEASDRSDLLAILPLAGLLARGPYDQALGEAIAHALNAGDREMQAAVSDGLRWTEWSELAAPILQSLQMSPIFQEIRERLELIYARLIIN